MFSSISRATENQGGKTGFTLIEVLVVVAIIAVLAAILFPVFARVRENARRSSCQSNLKQIGLGMLQYCGDYDDKLVRAWYGANGASDATLRYKWMDAIAPYLKSEQIFNCPSHTFPSWSGGAYKFRSGNQYGSYAINSTYYDPGDFEQSPAGEVNTSLAAIEDAAGCVWVGDSSGHFEFAWANKNTGEQEVVEVDSSGLRYLAYLSERHLASTDVLFCDGHVKSMRLDALARKNAAGAYPAFTIQDDND